MGTLSLTRHTASFALSLAALVGLWATAGCSAAIKSAAIEDAQTAVRVKTALVNDPALGDQIIEVRVTGGVVRLSGSVRSADEARRAVELARSIPGVKDVQAGLQVVGQPSPPREAEPRPPSAPEVELQEAPDDRRLLAVGGFIGWSGPRAGTLGARTWVGPLVRLGSGRGLGLAIGFSWFRADLFSSPGRQEVLGRVHVKPVMAGAGYTLASNRVSVSLTLVGGIAFNSFSLGNNAGAGAGRAALEVDNSFAWRSGVSVWYETSRRTAVNVFAGYLVTRPRVTFLEDGRLERRAVRGDTAVVRVGVAYKLF